MIAYHVIEETLWNEDFGYYTAFGICASFREDDGNGSVPVVQISDLFLDRERAEEFAALCNRCKLSIVHLNDVIDNLLALV